jgi:hypothetical protein
MNPNDFINEDDDDSDDSNSDSDDDDLYLDPDEARNTRFNLVLCELYCVLHGHNSDDKMYYHYLTIFTFKWFNSSAIYKWCDYYSAYYHYILNHLAHRQPFSPIRNFNTIVSKNNYIKPEIAETIILESGHRVCILKTFWLRLIQRTWKRIYKERCLVIKLRGCYASIREREVTGLWPERCRVYPGLTCCLKLK